MELSSNIAGGFFVVIATKRALKPNSHQRLNHKER